MRTSTRLGIALAALGLAGLLGAGLLWLRGEPGPDAAPAPSAALEPGIAGPTDSPEAPPAEAPPAEGEPAAVPGSARPARAPEAPSLWSRLASSVRGFFAVSSADEDGDGRLDDTERTQAHDRIEQRRARARADAP